MAERVHDVVLFGATGFTGGLTADYLAEHAGPDVRLALAGRNRQKLESVRERLAAVNPAHADLALLEADVTDAASLRAVAESTKVVITTVGPYIRYGEPLVAACAAAGTGYVDLTGEPEFVDLMYLRHHEQAVRSGARIVHSCGFDSIPYDLGVLFAVQHLPEGVPLKLEGYVRAGGTFSGGTYHSAVEAMGRLRQSVRTARERRQREGRPAGRKIRGEAGAPRRAPTGGWAVPFPTIDPQNVLRSAAALERYGPDFSYGHYLVLPNLPMVAGLAAGAGGVDRAGPAAGHPQAPVQGQGPGRRSDPRATGQGVVQRPHRRRGWRSPGRGRGVRRRSGLRRHGQDARRVRPLPGARRSAGDGRPDDDRGGHGGRPHRPVATGRDPLRGAGGRSRVTPATGADALRVAQDAFGVHPGCRALHSRGTLLAGTFTATPAAAALSRAAHLQGEPRPGDRALLQRRRRSGDPGLRARRAGDGGEVLPARTAGGPTSSLSPRRAFRSRTPEAFLALITAQKRTAASLWRLPLFLARHPGAAARLPKNLPGLVPPVSYATSSYHAVHAFGLIDAADDCRFVRYTLVPEAGEARLRLLSARKRGRDYLQEEIRERVAREPVRFTLSLQLAAAG